VGKRPGRNADNSLSSSVKVKNEWICTSTFPIHHHASANFPLGNRRSLGSARGTPQYLFLHKNIFLAAELERGK
jgi:hypothetical protein